MGKYDPVRARERMKERRSDPVELEKIRTRERERARRINALPRTKERHRLARLLKMWGLSAADYAALESLQNGVCAICKHPEGSINARTGKVRRLAVDHNHATGRIRGLLCYACNIGIGMLGDSAETMRAAAAYLDRDGACTSD